MPSQSTPKIAVLRMAGDAALISAATVALGPLSLLIGPLAAWYLHGRRIDRDAIVAGIAGVAIAGVATAATVLGLVFFGRLVEPAGMPEEAGGIVLLASATSIFGIVLVALNVDALHDVFKARLHVRLDVVRFVMTGLVVAGAAVIVVVQRANPASEVGDAGPMALMAALVAGIAVAIAHAIVSRRRSSSASVPPEG